MELDLATLTYLGKHDFIPGTDARVRDKAPDGTLALELDGGTVALGPALAQLLFVEQVYAEGVAVCSADERLISSLGGALLGSLIASRRWREVGGGLGLPAPSAHAGCRRYGPAVTFSSWLTPKRLSTAAELRAARPVLAWPEAKAALIASSASPAAVATSGWIPW